MSAKTGLAVLGGVASILVGTYLTIAAVIDWNFCVVPIGLSGTGYISAYCPPGGYKDLYLIVLGAPFYALGAILFQLSRKSYREISQKAPILVGYGLVVASIAGIRFIGYVDLTLFIVVFTALFAIVYSYIEWKQSHKNRRNPKHVPKITG